MDAPPSLSLSLSLPLSLVISLCNTHRTPSSSFHSTRLSLVLPLFPSLRLSPFLSVSLRPSPSLSLSPSLPLSLSLPLSRSIMLSPSVRHSIHGRDNESREEKISPADTGTQHRDKTRSWGNIIIRQCTVLSCIEVLMYLKEMKMFHVHS